MPDNPDQGPISGETGAPSNAPEPRQSLREIAEASYDEISSPDYDPNRQDDGSAPSDRGDGRDRRGRFASKEQAQRAGEAEAEPPSPDQSTETQTQADPAKGNQPPEHWSAEDKASFSRLPHEAKSFLMRRYNDMEADYTRKSQQNAAAVQVFQALDPVFNDPEISRSLQDNNMHPVQAVYDWARMHKGAISPDPQVRAGVLYEIAQRMGFDPAKVFAPSRPPVQLSPEQQRDPTIQFFAELQGKANSDLQALRTELQQFKAQENERIQTEAVNVTRGSIDAFADEKGQDGKPLRPHFDKVIGNIISMFKENPQRDMREAYETACWMDPEVRKLLMTEERSRASQQQSNQRAMQAARSNVRGMTSPVSKPESKKKGNGNLRDTLEASADEVGF
jgi:hypothetical protein